MAADPTYPLYPVLNIIAAALLLLVLLSSAVRQSWNLAVTFLCFWLFWESIFNGVGGIIWSDNADIRLLAYCDLVTRVQLASFVVKPMATFILMRRLNMIAKLQTVAPSQRRRELMIEWALGFVIPGLVAGPLYYVVQLYRFEVIEAFGCTNAISPSVLGVLICELWAIIPPLACVIFYYPNVVRVFYSQSRNLSINHFMRSQGSHVRILAIASIDLILTLPMGIVALILNLVTLREQGRFPFYSGWSSLHSDLVPPGVPYERIVADGPSSVAFQYYAFGTAPVLAFAIFGLFGLTAEARSSYRRSLYAVGDRIGLKVSSSLATHKRTASDLESLEFEVPSRGMTLDTEVGSTFVAFSPSTLGHRDCEAV